MAIGTLLLLLIPLVLTIRDGAVEGVGWNWTLFDFVFAFVVIFGSGLAFELISRKMPNNSTYKIAALVGVFILNIFFAAAFGLSSLLFRRVNRVA